MLCSLCVVLHGFKYAFLLSGFIGFSGLAVQICLSNVGFYRALWLGVGSDMPFYCGASCKVSPRFLAKWAPQYCCKVGPPSVLIDTRHPAGDTVLEETLASSRFFVVLLLYSIIPCLLFK